MIAVFAAYIATLLWAYIAIISPAFSYAGYTLYGPAPARIVWIFIFALSPAAFVPIRLSRPSTLVVLWLYATVYIPSILLPALSLTLSFAELLPLDTAILICLGLLTLATSVRLLALRRPGTSAKYFWPAVFVLWACCLAFVGSQFRMSTLILNVGSLFVGGDLYSIRDSFFEQLSQTGRILGYASGQVGEAIDPFLIAYGLVYRRRELLLVGVAGQLILFAVAGNKSILFSTLFPAVVLVLMRRFPRNFAFALGSLLVGVVLVSAGADTLSKSIIVSSMTTRRTLMDPGLLTGFYFEHYSQVPHAGLAYHFLQGGRSVQAPSYEIGLVYFGDANIDANANLWAEGFADFGALGIVGFTLLLAAILWMYDSIATRRNAELAIVLMAMQAFFFSNSAPMTVFITHGGLGSALLLWFTPSTEPAEIETKEISNNGGVDPIPVPAIL